MMGLALAMAVSSTCALGATKLTVQWDDNSHGESGFKIERSTNGKTFSTIATIKANQTSYTDTSVAPATTYWYRVKAYDLLRSSGYSNVTSAKTPSATPAPAKPVTPPPPKPAPAPAKPAPSTNKPTPAPTPAKPATGTTSRFKVFTARAVTEGTGAQSMVLNFTTTGSSRSILLRGIGPGLASYTTSKTLPDPKIKLTSGSMTVGSNDNWGGSTTLASIFKQAGAFPLSSSSKDAAMRQIMGSGNYSLVLYGGSSGLAQAEIYDVDTAPTSTGRFSKISVRAPVKTGSGVLIGGFVVSGDKPIRLLVRAIGPGLTGVSGVLKDPQLSVHRGSTLIATNNNWGGSSSLTSAFKQVGAATLSASSKDAAALVSVSAGTYTVTVSGVSNSAGIARLEIFVMP